MSTTTARPETKRGQAGRGPGGVSRGWGEGGGRGDFRKPSATSRMGMAFALAGIAMLFVALTSAYVVRHGLDPDWRAIRMPTVLPVNTVVLLLSSITMELARRALKPAAAQRWLTATLALGAAFVAGQLVAWSQLATGGVYLGTNPHSSFFYLLTGLHGLHLLGGIAALSYVAFEWRPRGAGYLRRATDVTALYWHFMDALWLYLFVLLFAWR